MPLVRIDLPAGQSPDTVKMVGDIVYETMRAQLNVPENDRFMVIHEHTAESLILDPTYLGVNRSKNALIIQITLNEGRSLDVKKAFYHAVADGLHDRLGMRIEDVFINLVEVKKENWSFGNGLAQYA